MIDTDAAVVLTAREAARLLRVSVSTLYRLQRAGRLPKVCLSTGVVRYRRADLERLAASSTRLHEPALPSPRPVAGATAAPVWLDPTRMNPATGRPYGSRRS